MFRHTSVVILLAALAAPPFAPAADKLDIKIAELQRDVASLQDMVKQLQQSQNDRLAAIQAATQQALEAATHANSAIAAIQTNLQKSLQVQEEKVVTPVVGLSTRMDNLSNDVRTVQNNVGDLSGAINKIMARLDDINNAVKLINAPPIVPPTVLDSGSASNPGGSPNATMPGGGQPSTPPGSATDMYQNAVNDYQGGNMAFAMSEFQNFLKFYDDSPFAPTAQFYIGQIHYAQNNFDAAVKDFDLVLEKYPESSAKNAEAQYYKGMSLLKLARRNEAETEFRQLIMHHPRTATADQACQRIKELGKTCPIPPTSSSKKGASRKD